MLRMKNFNVLGVHWKIRLLRGYSQKTNIEGGDCLKRGDFGLFTALRGGLGKKEGGGVFEGKGGGGVETPMHIM